MGANSHSHIHTAFYTNCIENPRGCSKIRSGFNKKKMRHFLPYNAFCSEIQFIQESSQGGKWYQCCLRSKGGLKKLLSLVTMRSTYDYYCKEVNRISDDGVRICFADENDLATFDETQCFCPQLDHKLCVEKSGVTDKWVEP